MKDTAAERLSKAISSLLIRIDDHCNQIANSEIRYGLCHVYAKKPDAKPPSSEILQQIQERARNHFVLIDATHFYLRYFTLPPPIEGENINTSATLDDFQVTFFPPPKLDASTERELRARFLLYCPDEYEVGGWDEWFSPQLEAMRLLPLFHEGVIQLKIIGLIRSQLMQPWANVFEFFIQNYIKSDDNLTERDRECVTNWRLHYPEVEKWFPYPDAPLFKAFKTARKKAALSRNPKIKPMLWAFVEYIEGTLIHQSELPKDMKNALLNELQERPQKKTAPVYPAKRPALCLSDIECGQLLYQLIQKFITSPKASAILGEIILFIWIAQHTAFASKEIDIDEILNISVTDIDFENLTVKILRKEINITGGLAEILLAWIGTSERQNKRRLLPSLTRDNLEKNLVKLSISFFGIEWKLQPRDFLAKVHPIPGARILMETRKKIDEQAALIKGSPYLISTKKIRKHILASSKKNDPTHTFKVIILLS